jgi:SAM-dependent methyltransferase
MRSKYEEYGAYHWRAFEDKGPTQYRAYVLGLKKWLKFKETDVVLDVGAGDGLITSRLRGIVVGIDPDKVAVQHAREHDVDVRLGSAYDLPFEEETFDVIFMGDVIEHLENPEEAIREIHRVLKMGGKLYITTPPKGDEMHDPYHYQEYTVKELIDFVTFGGFELDKKPFTRCVRIHACFVKRSRLL